jgi:hypothetical protein
LPTNLHTYLHSSFHIYIPTYVGEYIRTYVPILSMYILWYCLRKYLLGWDSVEFRDFSDSGPFELRNFHWNFIFPIVKCVPTNSEHVSSGSESSPAINSSDFMNRKTFPQYLSVA